MKGSLQERNGKYYAVFRIDGKQKLVNLNIPTTKGNKRKAEQAMMEAVVLYQSEDMKEKTEFSKYVEKWLEGVKNTVDSITYEGYRQDSANHIIPYFKDKGKSVEYISIADIEEYYIAKAKGGRLDGRSGGLSLNTIRLHKVILNMVLKQAVIEKLIMENPCIYARLPTSLISVPKRTPTFYTAKQCKELLKLVENTPLYSMIYITFMYGLRRSEMLGLKWDAVDFEANTITIRHTVVMQDTIVKKDRTKTADSMRTYPLLPDVQKILEDMKKAQRKNKKLFGKCYEDSGTYLSGRTECFITRHIPLTSFVRF